MAFIANAVQGNNNNIGFEKASAFINILVPTRSGGKKKLGSIALKDSNATHSQIIAKLKAGDETTLQKLVDILEFNFVEVGAESEEDAIAF